MATNTLHDWDSNMLSGSLTDISSVSGDGYQPGTYIKADELNTILRETSLITKAFIDYLCDKSTGSDSITALTTTSVVQNLIDSVIATSGGGQIQPASSAALGGIKAQSVSSTTNLAQAKIATDQFLYVPVATSSSTGVVKAATKTSADTEKVAVDSAGQLWYAKGAYTLPVANANALGGVKAVAKSSETSRVAIDSNGQLWYTPGSGGGSYILPVANTNTLGGVKAYRTSSTAGKTRVEGTSDGTLYYTDTQPNNGQLSISWKDGSASFTANQSGNSSAAIDYVEKAAKLDNTSAIGSTDQPVYFTANGVPAQCTNKIPSFSYSNKVLTITVS